MAMGRLFGGSVYIVYTIYKNFCCCSEQGLVIGERRALTLDLANASALCSISRYISITIVVVPLAKCRHCIHRERKKLKVYLLQGVLMRTWIFEMTTTQLWVNLGKQAWNFFRALISQRKINKCIFIICLSTALQFSALKLSEKN